MDIKTISKLTREELVIARDQLSPMCFNFAASLIERSTLPTLRERVDHANRINELELINRRIALLMHQEFINATDYLDDSILTRPI